jgi:5-methyltetrahydrofolate--homocysteine methyltransferase
MEQQLKQLAICVEKGKVDKNSPYPADMKDQVGAYEITKQLLEAGVPAGEILQKSLMVGMNSIGAKFGEGKAFIPELLIAAKAMNAAMVHLKPYFESGKAKHRGTFIIGTVAGDLHDIGKNIVGMVLEGGGWKVIDLGVNVSVDKFINTLAENNNALVGMSALLTTTMLKMGDYVARIKQNYPGTLIFVGGAPLSNEFNDKIGADGYFRDPQTFVKYLATIK